MGSAEWPPWLQSCTQQAGSVRGQRNASARVYEASGPARPRGCARTLSQSRCAPPRGWAGRQRPGMQESCNHDCCCVQGVLPHMVRETVLWTHCGAICD